MVQCAIVGARGFTGIELVRILSKHPNVTLTSLTTRSPEPGDIRELIPTLPKGFPLKLEAFHLRKVADRADAIFLAVPHTTAQELAHQFVKAGKIVIDLSADFRLRDARIYRHWYKKPHRYAALLHRAVYGLPELYRDAIRTAELIANPGCYPTGALLGLLPLLTQRLVDPEAIVIDAKSGVSGAGRNVSQALQFYSVDGNFKAYKVNAHQHMPEIEGVLTEQLGKQIHVTFVPHLLPLERGILTALYLTRRPGVRASQIKRALTTAYAAEPFVRVHTNGQFPTLKDVAFTNFCDIGIWSEPRSDRVIVISAIDNLGKGASGQAVQNLNIRCGFPEIAGLV